MVSNERTNGSFGSAYTLLENCIHDVVDDSPSVVNGNEYIDGPFDANRLRGLAGELA